MKKIDAFKCEKCGSVYTKKKEAEDCEDLHVDLENVEIVPDNFYTRGETMPSTISLRNTITRITVGYTKQLIFDQSKTKKKKKTESDNG